MSKQQNPTQARGEKEPKSNEADILASLLENLPSTDAIVVDVPSKCKFYKLDNPAEGIKIRPMTFEDEKAMMSHKNVNIDTLNLLLERCVSNVRVSSLLQMDKLYLIMKLREISYGDAYGATISCPSCRRDNTVQFSLSQLQVNYLPEDAENPAEVFLPVLQKTIKLRYPRVADEGYLQNSELTLANLWRFVESIEGHDKKTIISKVMSQLPLKDSHAVISALGGGEYGIDTDVRFVCSYCGHNEITALPITADFFTGN
jgi:hypothetical protein